MSSGKEEELFDLNGLSVDSVSINQDGELKVTFDLPVEQTTPQYLKQLQGVRTFDVYQDPELKRLCRDLFRAIRRRVMEPDPERLQIACERCKTSDCCRNYNVLVTEADIALLREVVMLGEEEFRRRYLRPAVDWCEDYPFQLAVDHDGRGEKCVFLKESEGGQMRCSVYEHRPRICRDFDEKTCDDFVPLEEVAVLPGPPDGPRGQ
jgi:Fe-S-cluster containining protein